MKFSSVMFCSAISLLWLAFGILAANYLLNGPAGDPKLGNPSRLALAGSVACLGFYYVTSKP